MSDSNLKHKTYSFKLIIYASFAEAIENDVLDIDISAGASAQVYTHQIKSYFFSKYGKVISDFLNCELSILYGLTYIIGDSNILNDNDIASFYDEILIFFPAEGGS